MREILFRGKRMDNGKWVEGNLFIPDLPDTPTQICIGTNVVRITYDVIPKTVGQYTGLTDKNGKKIFEGDILRIPYHPEEDVVIEWNNGRFCFRRKFKTYYESLCCVQGITEKRKIIDNIHDNPELLNGMESESK